MPDSIHAGDVLADRYRLEDLLAESKGGRFWRAHDAVLHRHVAVHLMALADPRAPVLIEAARRTAPHHDRRILRVLDADQTAGFCYVVNEWGQGTSLDIMLANEGPLQPRRAAWIVSEVADSLARAHASGLAHGRMVPENVLIDLNGQVRIIGFGVDAALHGLPPGRRSADVVDTAAVLYAALTGKWAGVSASQLPPAPIDHGTVLRPRRVRAGIPRPLDTLCDEVINTGRAPRGPHDLGTAQGIADALVEFVGDPTALMDAESQRDHRPTTGLAASWAATAATPSVPRVPAAPPAPAPAPVDQPTQAGMPVFDDRTDDVGWIAARAEKPTPPPPLADPEARPLFAPEPPAGQPVRRAREGTRAASAPDYWPWEQATGTGVGVTTGSGLQPAYDDTDAGRVPGRNWFRLAMLLGFGLLILLAALAAFQAGRGGGDEPSGSSTGGQSATAAPTPFELVGVSDLDPQGSPPQDEYPELAPLVLDGDPATSWHTSTYKQNFGPGGLKDGVGLVVDLGAAKGVRQVDVATLGGPTAVSVFVTSQAPTDVEGLTPVGTAADNGELRVSLDEAVSGRFVTVWLTSLPEVDGGFRGTVADVVVGG